MVVSHKAPLCKGGWRPKGDWGIVKYIIFRKYIKYLMIRKANSNLTKNAKDLLNNMTKITHRK